MMIKTIYFDMDGVLVDLDKTLSDIIGQDVRTVKPPEHLTADGSVKKLIRDNLNNGVFAASPPAKEFSKLKELMRALQASYNVEILSSCMESKSFDEIRKQKIAWLKQHGLGSFPRNFTVSGRAKAYWAEPSALLIDDMKANCEAFIKAGGHAIQYHEDFNRLKRELFNLL